MADKADILIRVGAKGEYAVGGESGELIKKQLEAQLVKGIQIKVGIDEAQVAQALKAQLANISKSLTVGAGAQINAVSGASNLDAILKENLGIEQKINLLRLEQQQAITTRETLKTETALRKSAAQATKEQGDAARKTSAASASLKSTQANFAKYLTTVKASAAELKKTEIQDIFKKIDTGQLKEAEIAIRGFKAEMKSMGAEGGNVFTYLGEKMKTFSVYLMSSGLTMAFVSSMRKAIDLTFDLNEAMVDLRIVTNGSQRSAEELLGTYNRMAMELGSTTAAISSSAVEWQRQGYNLADTNQLIKDSMVLSTVGLMDEAEASEALTAALKGYQLQASQATSVVDKFTSVDLKAATSAGNLAVALSKTAANAKLAGLSLNDVIGQLAVVNETMKEAPESTGKQICLAA